MNDENFPPIAVARRRMRHYDLPLRYEWNPAKRASNLAKHGIEFEVADNFDWDTAVIEVDVRRDYGEERFRALGLIEDQLHMLVFTERESVVRIISLRVADRKEKARYAKSH